MFEWEFTIRLGHFKFPVDPQEGRTRSPQGKLVLGIFKN